MWQDLRESGRIEATSSTVATNATGAARKLRVLSMGKGLGKHHGVFQMNVTVQVGLKI